jgi:DNA-binding winged helix-turn-helix (wHTH) protein
LQHVGVWVAMAEKKLRFGQFVLDFGRFQLFRAGEPLRLEGLPLRLLMYLVEHHGELVTREQIADTLWGKDIFVDVEMGINTAIRKIRMALEDDSSQPQYLQTVVGHGYRFVAEFSRLEETSASTDSAKVSLEELGQAIMAAAGVHPEDEKQKAPPKDPPKP